MRRCLAATADATDASALRQVIRDAQERFGALHGVFHLATISDRSAYDAVEDISREQCERHFASKARVAEALAEALGDEPVDFVVLFSSLAAVLGGLSFIAYTAANIYLDAFSSARSGWRSIDWDTWRVRPDAHVLVGGTIAEYEMTPDEGLDVLERVLAAERRRHAPSCRPATSTRASASGSSWSRCTRRRRARPPAANGPDLPTAYTPPSSDVERQITAVWQDALGIDDIGIYDNFFDLGGNSLVALQVIARLKAQLKVPLPVVALFEAPTISALARYVQPEAADDPDDQRVQLGERRKRARQTSRSQPLAIVGMAGRFPWRTVHRRVLEQPAQRRRVDRDLLG